MLKLRFLIALLALGVLVSLPVRSQERVDALIARLKQTVNLTDDQAVRIRPAMLDLADHFKKLLDKYAPQGWPGVFPLNEELWKTRTETEKAIVAALTKEQYANFITIRNEMRQALVDGIRDYAARAYRQKMGVPDDKAAAVESILGRDFEQKAKLLDPYREVTYIPLGDARQLQKDLNKVQDATDKQLEPLLTKDQKKSYAKIREQAQKKAKEYLKP
jgi:hypothetical protein